MAHRRNLNGPGWVNVLPGLSATLHVITRERSAWAAIVGPKTGANVKVVHDDMCVGYRYVNAEPPAPENGARKTVIVMIRNRAGPEDI